MLFRGGLDPADGGGEGESALQLGVRVEDEFGGSGGVAF